MQSCETNPALVKDLDESGNSKVVPLSQQEGGQKSTVI